MCCNTACPLSLIVTCVVGLRVTSDFSLSLTTHKCCQCDLQTPLDLTLSLPLSNRPTPLRPSFYLPLLSLGS